MARSRLNALTCCPVHHTGPPALFQGLRRPLTANVPVPWAPYAKRGLLAIPAFSCFPVPPAGLWPGERPPGSQPLGVQVRARGLCLPLCSPGPPGWPRRDPVPGGLVCTGLGLGPRASIGPASLPAWLQHSRGRPSGPSTSRRASGTLRRWASLNTVAGRSSVQMAVRPRRGREANEKALSHPPLQTAGGSPKGCVTLGRSSRG